MAVATRSPLRGNVTIGHAGSTTALIGNQAPGFGGAISANSTALGRANIATTGELIASGNSAVRDEVTLARTAVTSVWIATRPPAP